MNRQQYWMTESHQRIESCSGVSTEAKPTDMQIWSDDIKGMSSAS
jgi:hypothetical protein